MLAPDRRRRAVRALLPASLQQSWPPAAAGRRRRAVAGVGSRTAGRSSNWEPTTDGWSPNASFEALREKCFAGNYDFARGTGVGCLECSFGGLVSTSATFVSSTLIRCPTAPMNSFGPQPLSITLNGQQYHPTGVSFNLYKRLPRWGLGALPLSMPLDVLASSPPADLYGTDYRLVVEDDEVASSPRTTTRTASSPSRPRRRSAAVGRAAVAPRRRTAAVPADRRRHPHRVPGANALCRRTCACAGRAAE